MVLHSRSGRHLRRGGLDYLSYGFWLKTTTKDGVVTYNEVETFTRLDGMTEATTGTVTGGLLRRRCGRRVREDVVTAGGGMVESATSGHFTADASLMAYFGQTTDDGGSIPPNMENTVTGTISNFMLAGGEDNDWSVALKGDITDANWHDHGRHGQRRRGRGFSDLHGGRFYGAARRDARRHDRGWRIQRQLQQRLGPAASGRASSRTSRQVRLPSMRT